MKIGIDLVHIPTFQKRLEHPNVVKNIFSEDIQNKSIQSLAGMFALKEAFFKATQLQVAWNAIVVKYDVNGRPFIEWDKTLLTLKSIDCSVSHDGEYAVAIVIVE